MVHDIHFGLTIKKLMKSQNITLEDISNLLGYTTQGFGRILKKKDINTDVLRKVSEALNIELVHFFDSNSSFNQIGNANIAGTGHVKYNSENSTVNDSNKTEVLLNENKHLKKQIELLEHVIELMKPKAET